jgi:hypothetical protein
MSGDIVCFAGWQHTEDWVSGGTGPTIETAVNDYLFNDAEEETDYACCEHGDTLYLTVWNTLSRNEAIESGIDEDELDEQCTFVLNEVVERREYRICMDKDGRASFDLVKIEAVGGEL